MARLPRLSVANHQHPVLQCGNDDRIIFQDSADIAMFRGILQSAAVNFGVAIHAYALLPTRFHLLVTPDSDEGLGKLMQWLGRHYVPYFNRRYHRSGTLWQGRFKSLIIDSDDYFMLCSRYIESSPVRFGLVSGHADFRDSSYLHHIGALVDPLITDHPLYWNLGNTPFQREAAYRELMEQALTLQQTEDFTQATLKGWPLGSSRFMANLEKHAKRRIAPMKRGRPRLETARLPVAADPNAKQ